MQCSPRITWGGGGQLRRHATQFHSSCASVRIRRHHLSLASRAPTVPQALSHPSVARRTMQSSFQTAAAASLRSLYPARRTRVPTRRPCSAPLARPPTPSASRAARVVARPTSIYSYHHAHRGITALPAGARHHCPRSAQAILPPH